MWETSTGVIEELVGVWGRRDNGAPDSVLGALPPVALVIGHGGLSARPASAGLCGYE